MLDFSEKWDKDKRSDFVNSQPGESRLDKYIEAYVQVENAMHELLWMDSFEGKLQQQVNAQECQDRISASIACLIVRKRCSVKDGYLVLDNP